MDGAMLICRVKYRNYLVIGKERYYNSNPIRLTSLDFNLFVFFCHLNIPFAMPMSLSLVLWCSGQGCSYFVIFDREPPGNKRFPMAMHIASRELCTNVFGSRMRRWSAAICSITPWWLAGFLDILYGSQVFIISWIWATWAYIVNLISCVIVLVLLWWRRLVAGDVRISQSELVCHPQL